jgi:hypothetical protein
MGRSQTQPTTIHDCVGNSPAAIHQTKAGKDGYTTGQSHESYRAHNKERLCERGLQAIFLTAQVSRGLRVNSQRLAMNTEVYESPSLEAATKHRLVTM